VHDDHVRATQRTDVWLPRRLCAARL